MKKYIYLCIGMLMLSSACSDFLREEPKSEMQKELDFSDPKHAWSAVNMLYREGIQNLCNASSAYNGPKLMSGSYMSGFFDNPKYKGQEQFLVQSMDLELNSQTSANYLDGIWDPCYKAISRANLAISKIPQTPGLTEPVRKQLLAEAYFFRAFNYFYLVKYFGDIPLVIDPLPSEVTISDLEVPRTDTKLVYQRIVQDLVFASEVGNLPDVPMCKNQFRVSKGAVNSLLAHVYLQMSGYPTLENKYVQAAATARAIINSGNYKLIPNGPSLNKSAYNVMRTSDVENEYMYQVEYKAGISESFWMPVYSFPVTAASWAGAIFKYSITADVFVPKPQLLAMYDKNEDIRIQEKQFFHTNFSYSYSVKENGNDVIKNVTENFDPLPYLWFDTTALFVSGHPNNDLKLYRYAEVLLIAAEAIAQAEGVNAEAASYLAQVRSRASLTKKSEQTIQNQLITLSKAAFIEEVWKERLREFPLEFKIWDDIQRTRKIMKTGLNNNGEINFVNVIGSTSAWGKTFKEKDLLYPISYNEIQRNPKLTQNKGY